MNVTIITITLNYTSTSQVNLTNLRAAILQLLNLTAADAYRIVFLISSKRDVAIGFYIASADLTSRLFNALMESPSTALIGFPLTTPPTSAVQTIDVPVITTASITSGTVEMVEQDESSGLTTNGKIAIGVLVPIGVIMIASVIIYILYKDRHHNSNGDTEVGSRDASTTVEMKAVESAKPIEVKIVANDTTEDQSSSDMERDSSSSSDSDRKSSSSSKSESDSD